MKAVTLCRIETMEGDKRKIIPPGTLIQCTQAEFDELGPEAVRKFDKEDDEGKALDDGVEVVDHKKVITDLNKLPPGSPKVAVKAREALKTEAPAADSKKPESVV